MEASFPAQLIASISKREQKVQLQQARKAKAMVMGDLQRSSRRIVPHERIKKKDEWGIGETSR